MAERTYGELKYTLEEVVKCWEGKTINDMAAHIRKLEAEVARLKSDAKRMDWLEAHHGWLEQRRVGSKRPTWAACHPFTNYEYSTYYSAREAIDAAIVEQELNK